MVCESPKQHGNDSLQDMHCCEAHMAHVISQEECVMSCSVTAASTLCYVASSVDYKAVNFLNPVYHGNIWDAHYLLNIQERASIVHALVGICIIMSPPQCNTHATPLTVLAWNIEHVMHAWSLTARYFRYIIACSRGSMLKNVSRAKMQGL